MSAGQERRPRARLGPLGAELGLVGERLALAGWEVDADGPYDLWWSLHDPAPGEVGDRAPGSMVNHLAGISAIVRKDDLWRTTERHRSLLVRRGLEVPQLVPDTYLMPEDWSRFQAVSAASPEAVWIQKPRAAGRGEGISLLEDPSSAESGSNWLVQRYLDRPHTLDGRKYTLRFYVLISSVVPLKAFVFDDGFTKLASRAFLGAARADRFAHLTNPDVQAENPEVEVSADNLTHPAYRDRLRAEGFDPDALFARIHRALGLAVAAAREPLARAAWSDGAGGAGRFELLGFDALIDEDLRPWLLEANLSPSLKVEARADRAGREEAEVKTRLVDSTLRRLGLLAPGAGDALASDGFRPLWEEGEQLGWLTLPRPEELEGRELDLHRSPTRSWVFDDGLAIHSPTDLHLLDAAASFVWAGLEDGLGLAEITEELKAAVPDAHARLGADVWNTAASWVEAGLLLPGGQGGDGRDRPEPPGGAGHRAAVAFVEWNPGGVYEAAGVRVGVSLPSPELAGWVESAVGLWRGSGDGSVVGEIRVDPSPSGWTVSWEGRRVPHRTDRQVGSVVREALLELVANRTERLAVRATALERSGRSVLVTGAPNLRLQLALAWISSGGRCLADDLVLWTDGAFHGVPTGLVEAWDGDWYGPLPTWHEDDALHVTVFGDFVRYQRLPVEPEPVRPDCFLHLTHTRVLSVLMALPCSARESAAELLASAMGSRFSVDEQDTVELLELVAAARSYRATPGDPSASIGIVDALLER